MYNKKVKKTDAPEWTTPKQSDLLSSPVIQEVEKIVGDRETQYGPPDRNFQDIADVWNWYLKGASRNRDILAEGLTKTDVAMLMALLKLARNFEKIKLDSFVDLINYVRIGSDFEFPKENNKDNK